MSPVKQKNLSVEVSGYLYPAYPADLPQRPTNPQVLHDVLERARSLGQKGVVVFDLDGTLLNNHPRHARILREFGKEHNIPALTLCKPEHIDGWSLAKSMIACGVPKEQANELDAVARAFWVPRFFTSEYCVDDVQNPGAVAYVKALQDTGVVIAYCTGRHNAMDAGTILCMEREGFPVPNNKNVYLLSKPTFDMTDDAWKSEAYPQIRSLGTLVAEFDNEPSHVNSYHDAFPGSLMVHLLTEESGRGIAVYDTIPSVKDFLLP